MAKFSKKKKTNEEDIEEVSDVEPKENKKKKSFLSEDKKDEIKWWIEDHKSKFYTICGVVGVALVSLVIVLYSSLQPEPVIEAPEEDSYEELDIGGFDVEGQIQKEDNDENKKQEAEFGSKIELLVDTYNSKFTYIDTYNYGFVDVLVGDDSTPSKLYVDSNTFESGVLADSTYKLMEKYKDIFSLRCKLEDLPEDIKSNWEKRDKRNVLDMFRNAEKYPAHASKWESRLAEVKVSKGFESTDTIETIGKEKWNEIMDEMYIFFENYLLGLDNKSTGVQGPLSTYLSKTPYPDYSDVKIAKSPIYLCDVKSRGWDVFTPSNLARYRNVYLEAYYSDAEALLLNEDDYIIYNTLKSGKIYTLKKKVNFVLECAYPDEDIVLWYIDNKGEKHERFIPNANSVWSDDEDSYSEEEQEIDDANLLVNDSIKYFGYYIVGEKYKRSFVGKIPFETTKDNGELVVEQKDFDVEEETKYTRQGMLGDDIIINVSDFFMNDEAYKVPSGKYYIKNDTKEYLTLYTESESSSFSLAPGDEVYVDSSIKSFNWIFER